jgi:maltose O-acetyltransferase
MKTSKTEKEKMLDQKLYLASDQELVHLRNKAKEQIYAFNHSKPLEVEKRKQIIQNLFKATKENFHIEPPLYVDYGENIEIGNHFYANYDCIFLDVAKIKIGNNVLFGPRVCLYTAGHPIDHETRNEQLEFGYEIKIGDDVWIGGNTVINPGVNIGNRVVIGSGSVVTKDIPDDVVAFGNPCKVIRKITEEDKNILKGKETR